MRFHKPMHSKFEKSLVQRAREAGVSVTTIKRRDKESRDEPYHLEKNKYKS